MTVEIPDDNYALKNSRFNLEWDDTAQFEDQIEIDTERKRKREFEAESDDDSETKRDAKLQMKNILDTFKTIRDKLYMEKMQMIELELEALKNNNHPELNENLRKIENKRTEMIKQSQALYKLSVEMVKKSHAAGRSTIEFEFQDAKKTLWKLQWITRLRKKMILEKEIDETKCTEFNYSFRGLDENQRANIK
ncbi:hypothetical protein ROZALSC1DRAFT_30568 [Rozella allomycis CSF55]|uniref:Uncharacterized protein n=1 Tax=Rozella allomycis (strain CSF55) TaxID=988480 RepID=A0A075AUS5_ROZAC|nr:hypothetical protein O9G_004604 [Rozella allomycis CSF55]RKP17662.1 hypothetical protein ROZALSC1DRAFT_30568 [Rozella allomycis CSF55]|eukprot:EPZ34008.1 hypothetical protein O9G_004604 [Rozella allomycis CSF55]